MLIYIKQEIPCFNIIEYKTVSKEDMPILEDGGIKIRFIDNASYMEIFIDMSILIRHRETRSKNKARMVFNSELEKIIEESKYMIILDNKISDILK